MKTRTFLLFVLGSIFLIPACGTDNGGEQGNSFEDGISRDVRELVGEDLLDVIENDLEIPIHRGDSPPDIVAMLSQQAQKSTFASTEIVILMKPLLFLNANVPGDSHDPGDQFNDFYLRFSNQDMENYTIDFDHTHPGSTPYFGAGSFIIGNGNDFSIFGSSESERQEGTILSVEIFSGTITSEGISSPYSGFIMVDNGGIDGIVPNGTGRSFEDGDELAEVSTWPESAKLKLSGSDIPAEMPISRAYEY